MAAHLQVAYLYLHTRILAHSFTTYVYGVWVHMLCRFLAIFLTNVSISRTFINDTVSASIKCGRLRNSISAMLLLKVRSKRNII